MGKVRSKHFQKKALEVAKVVSDDVDDMDIEEHPEVEAPKDEKELELEKLVFGDLAGFQEGLTAREDLSDLEDGQRNDALVLDETVDDLAAMEDSDLFFVDSSTNDVVMHVDKDEGQQLTTTEVTDDLTNLAWEDSDDDRLTISLYNNPRLRKLRNTETDDLVTGKEYTKRLRIQFERINPKPDWALPSREKPKKKRRPSVSSSSSSSSEEEAEADIQQTESLSSLLQSSQGYVAQSKTGRLKPETLEIHRLRDANHSSQAKSGIQCLQFHPTHPLLLSSGFDHVLRLNHIDGKTNPPTTSLYLQSTAVHTAAFHPDGRRIFASGRRRFFHIWDLESGKVDKITRIYGQAEEQKSMEQFKLSPDGRYMSLVGSKGIINFLDASSGQWISSAKIEGQVSDLVWSRDGSGLMVTNKGGEVWEWDSRQRQFSSNWTDEGGIGTTKIALTPRWCAISSQSGIVNIYDRREAFSANPKPKKTLGNLVTSINVLEFSEDGQILCMASRAKSDQLRMVHLPSCTVFKNWPTSSTPLGRVQCATFKSGMFAAGNDQGKIRLWEIR